MSLPAPVRPRESAMNGAGDPEDRDDVTVLTADSLDAIADEWDALAMRVGATPFARPGWMRAWWTAFGRGDLCILTYRRGGQLRAVLPLARRRGLLHSCSNIHSPLFD